MSGSLIEKIERLEAKRRENHRPNRRYFMESGWDDQYPDALKRYHQDNQAISSEIKSMLLEEIGWAGKPGADDLYEYVVREHSPSGWHDMLFYLDTLSTLVENVIAQKERHLCA